MDVDFVCPDPIVCPAAAAAEVCMVGVLAGPAAADAVLVARRIGICGRNGVGVRSRERAGTADWTDRGVQDTAAIGTAAVEDVDPVDRESVGAPRHPDNIDACECTSSRVHTAARNKHSCREPLQPLRNYAMMSQSSALALVIRFNLRRVSIRGPLSGAVKGLDENYYWTTLRAWDWQTDVQQTQLRHGGQRARRGSN